MREYIRAAAASPWFQTACLTRCGGPVTTRRTRVLFVRLPSAAGAFHVSENQSRARFRLPGPDEMYGVLRKFADTDGGVLINQRQNRESACRIGGGRQKR